MNDFKKKQTSQNRPGREALSTESLNAMSPVELADALERMLEPMTDENYDPALIDAYLDALDEKAPMPEEPQTEEAFQKFKGRLSVLPLEEPSAARENRPTQGVRTRPFKRALVTIAATVALLFALMIGAQAAGIDVFGNLARWTDEVFFFIPSSSKSSFSSQFKQVLEDEGLPKELAPTWFPERFTMGDPDIWDDDTGKAVQLTFTNPEGKFFAVNVDYYQDAALIGTLTVEKNADDVEVYTSNGRTFYIMSNMIYHSAVWSDGNWIETITGELSVDEIKKMIDSIGG